MRPRRSWSHPIFCCDLNARCRSAIIGSSGVVRVGGVILVLCSQLVILSQMRFAMMSGVCCFLRCCQKAIMDLVRAVHLSSLGHRSMWFVSSQSCPQSKHRPSVVLSIVCCRRRVGSRSFIYFDNWIRCPMKSFLKDSPSGVHAIDSYIVSSHSESRPVASFERLMRYFFISGAFFAIRMYSGMLFVT